MKDTEELTPAEKIERAEAPFKGFETIGGDILDEWTDQPGLGGSADKGE